MGVAREAYVKTETYRKGQVVFRQGDPGDCLYFIRYGSVGVFVNYGQKDEKQLAKLGQNDYFGEMGLLDHASRSATVVSLMHETTLCHISDDEFEEFLHENPARVVDILQRLSHKLRSTTRKYLEICQAVSDSVGPQASEVSGSQTYGFADNQKLVDIHDSVRDAADDKA